MDCILNFVYDVWDEEKNEPKPNRLKTYHHPDDIEGTTWRISTDPMKVFADVKIINRRMEDVEKYPEEVFYYHVWNINCFNNRFFSNNILPVDLDVIEKVKKYDNLFLIIMNECEFEKKQALERLDMILGSLEVNPKKVWFIHNGEKLPEHKIELNTQINVHACRSMSTALKYGQRVDFIEDKEPGSFFLCMNRSPRIHRYAILCLLKKYNILDDTNWSLICGWDFKDRKYLFKEIFNIDDILDLNDEISYFTSLEVKKGKYEIEYAGLDNRNAQDLPNEPKTFENSYFNITTETNFSGEDIHITEKSFKPFFYFQFPLILASHNHIKYFRQAYPGLDFFDDVINHGYDDIKNDRDRLMAFFEQVKNINNNKEYYINFYKSNKERFIKNFEYLAFYENKYDHDFFTELSQRQTLSNVYLNLVYDNWDEEKNEPIQMNCRDIFYESFLQERDSFVTSLGYPSEYIKRYPLRDVDKYPNKKFFFFITHTPGQSYIRIMEGKSPMPQEVIDCLKRNPNFYVIFGNEQEYEHFHSFKALHYWLKSQEINANQIYMANNNIDLESYKEKLQSDINVFSTSKVSTHIYIAMSHKMPELKYKDDKTGKLFLSHNRRVRPHRYALLTLLKKEGLLDDVDWSLVSGYEATNFEFTNWYKEIFDVWDVKEFLPEIQYFHSIDIKKCMYEENESWFDDRENPDGVYWGDTYTEPTYMETYFNIVTESEYSSNTIHISEKSFKPFVTYQFPLILASPKHIKAIRKRYGFDFFDDVIDHSYDLELNHRERLFKFVKEIKRIHENKDFFIEFYKNNKERFIKNNELSKKLTHDTNDKDFLKKLTGLYDYEFQSQDRRRNEDFEEDFYDKQLEKYNETYVEPISSDEIENQKLIDEILNGVGVNKKKLI
jgi:hypothetical protein